MIGNKQAICRILHIGHSVNLNLMTPHSSIVDVADFDDAAQIPGEYWCMQDVQITFITSNRNGPQKALSNILTSAATDTNREAVNRSEFVEYPIMQ